MPQVFDEANKARDEQRKIMDDLHQDLLRRISGVREYMSQVGSFSAVNDAVRCCQCTSVSIVSSCDGQCTPCGVRDFHGDYIALHSVYFVPTRCSHDGTTAVAKHSLPRTRI